MRIALKMVLVFVAVAIAAITVETVVTSRLDEGLITEAQLRDQRILGRALLETAQRTWVDHGLDEAADLIEAAHTAEHEIDVRLVATVSEEAQDPGLPAPGGPGCVGFCQGAIGGTEPAFVTWLRVEGPDDEEAWLRLSSPRSRSAALERVQLVRLAILGAALTLALFGISLLLGRTLLGRPIEELVSFTRRVARGEHPRLQTERQDELGTLGRALDAMSEDLQLAREELEERTRAHLVATEQLYRADRLATVGTLAAGLAHELGTPLHVVAGRARRIAQAPDCPTGIREEAEVIRGQTERISRLMKDLLSFARPRPERHESLCLSKSAEHVVTLLRPHLRGHELIVESPTPERESAVQADADQVEQILTNLVLNATQAMPDGGVVEVAISSGHLRDGDDGEDQRFTTVEVRDRGVGIPPEERARVFDPFHSTKPPGEGTGLGLAIVHAIVQAHAGYVEIHAREGGGTCVVVWLPEGA